MPTAIPFFDKAGHQLAKLREKYPSRPRTAAWGLALWSSGKALSGRIIDETAYTRPTHTDNTLHLAFLLRGGIGDIVINLAWMDKLVSLAECPCEANIYTNTPESCMRALCQPCAYVRNLRSLKTRMDFASFDAVFDIMQLPQLKSCCEDRLRALSLPFRNYAQRLLKFQTSHSSFYMDENQAMGIHYADVLGTFRRGQADFDASLGLKNSDFTLSPALSLRTWRSVFPSARVTSPSRERPGPARSCSNCGTRPNIPRCWKSCTVNTRPCK